MGEASFETHCQTFTEKHCGGEGGGGRWRGSREESKREEGEEREDDFREDSVLGRFTIPGHNVCTCPVC